MPIHIGATVIFMNLSYVFGSAHSRRADITQLYVNYIYLAVAEY